MRWYTAMRGRPDAAGRLCVIAALLILTMTALSLSMAQDAPTPIVSPTPYLSPTPYMSPTVTYFSPGSIVLTITPTPGPDLAVMTDVVTARFNTTTYAPLTGEPFTLTLIVTLPQGFTLTEWPTLPEQWGDFVLMNVGEQMTTQLEAGVTGIKQDFIVLLWEPEDHTTPQTFVGYSDGTSTLRIPARETIISVPTVLIPGDENLRPLRPAVYLPYIPPLAVIGGIVIIGAGIGFGYRWWKNRPEPQIVVETRQPTPYEVAQSALQTLQNTPELSPEDRYARIGSLLRDYNRARVGLSGGDTTEELVTLLRDERKYPDKLIDELLRLLSAADLTKYAGVEADAEVAARLTEVAQRWITVAERMSSANSGHREGDEGG